MERTERGKEEEREEQEKEEGRCLFNHVGQVFGDALALVDDHLDRVLHPILLLVELHNVVDRVLVEVLEEGQERLSFTFFSLHLLLLRLLHSLSPSPSSPALFSISFSSCTFNLRQRVYHGEREVLGRLLALRVAEGSRSSMPEVS